MVSCPPGSADLNVRSGNGLSRDGHKVTAMFTPLHHKRFSDEIVEQIVHLITQGALKPGDTLPSERTMAHSLGVSRPPLREALKTLETLGFLEIFQRRKIVVKSITNPALYDPLARALEEDAEMVLQLLEVRKIFESWAAARASQVATDEEINALEGVFREMEEDLEKDRLGVDADVKLHLGIYRATHNTVLSHLASTLFELLRQAQTVTRHLIFEDHRNKNRLLRQHAAIVKAIRERNPRKARSAVLTHLRFAETQCEKRVSLKQTGAYRDPGPAGEPGLT